MPPKPNIKNVTLKPGVYCIDKEIRIGSQDSFIVQGTFNVSPGVFLYIKPGGSFTINAGSVVVIWGINQANVDANAALAPYKGCLIYTAPNYAGNPVTCTINGGNSSWFQGTIYAPYCNLTMNGGSGSDGFQTKVIAYTVKFSGNSTIYLTYNEDNSSDMTVPLQVGLSK